MLRWSMPNMLRGRRQSVRCSSSAMFGTPE
jgi:hypothetical protein